MAYALSNRGIIYSVTGRFPEAFEAYDRCIALGRKGGVTGITVHALINAGSTYFLSGDYAKAAVYYRESLEMLEQAGASPDSIARVVGNLGNVEFKRGHLAKALEAYEKTLDLRLQTDDRKGLSGSYENIAAVYYMTHQWERSLEYHKKSLAIRESLNDLEGISASHSNIGTLLFEKERYGRALEVFEKALEINRQLGNKLGEADVLNNLGEVYLKQGRLAEARQTFETCLALREQTQDKEGVAQSLSTLAHVFFLNGRPDTARVLVKRSLEVSGAIGADEQIRIGRMLLGEILSSEGKASEAATQYRKAVEQIEASRNDFTPAQKTLRRGVLERSLEAYAKFVESLLAAETASLESLSVLEKMKARSFLEALAVRDSEALSKSSQMLQNRKHNLEARMKWLQSKTAPVG